jgi:hypothetical protein
MWLFAAWILTPAVADDCAGGGDLPPGVAQSQHADIGVRPDSLLSSAGQLFGESVATGDFNGDGLGDFAVGGRGEGGGGERSGSTWVR